MQFRIFIASTMLIVLISQHSIMGLPTNSTAMNEIYLQDSTTISSEFEYSSTTPEQVLNHEEESVTELNTPENSGVCPEGMEHGKHGICEDVELPDTTEINVELTTDSRENVGGVENIKGCPTGTKPDEQGACQEIQPINSTKLITDLKGLLNKDGSCPDNYKMIDGRCLYIKSKTNSTLYPGSSIHSQMQNDFNTNSKLESVPVLPDNSCPEGTEYSEYGLCQKRAHISNSNLHMKSVSPCPDAFELINGKCTLKNSGTTVQPKLTTKKMRIVENTTVNQATTITEELPPIKESEITSTPL